MRPVTGWQFLTALGINVNVIYIHTMLKAAAMALFLMMILGFIWWWPLGLVILAALIASGADPDTGVVRYSPGMDQWAIGIT